MKIGDKVKPSRTCRPLYGDPNFLIIIEIEGDKYKTNLYSFWFEKFELEVVYDTV